ncbi:MAG TPA: energy-coupling factor transporter transmembrane component T [Gemmatimonadaceae bacterium]|nr:energy-coupling factor transporter transmembrane component T [Gemmatimonadaceae bacterium]
MSGALDRWNPLTPLAAALLLVVAAYTGPQPWSAVAALAIALGVATGSGMGRRVLALVSAVAIPTVLLLLIMSATSGDASAAGAGAGAIAIGSARVSRAAVLDALGVSLRLGAAVGALGWIVAGVSPRRLTRALAERGLPAWCAYVLVASLEAVPEARRRAREVQDAQRCRGLSTGGGVPGRLRALARLAGPLAVSLVTESEERALALDARGFDPRRRRGALAPIADRRGERLARAALWLALVALLAWRIARALRGAA